MLDTVNFYRIPKESLGKGARIPLIDAGTASEVFALAAREILDIIESHNANGQQSALIVPVGPVGQYPVFVDLVNKRGTDLRNTWFFNMDEYLGPDGGWIDPSHKLSFRGFMNRQVYGRIRPELLMPESQRIFPDPTDPGATDALLESLGGADACFGGIGINGHIAFNEPEDIPAAEFRHRPTRVLDISPETLTANAIGDLGGAIEAMPRRCVTIGMRAIMGARMVRLYCFRDWHRAVVRRAAYGEPSARFPASLLQGHPDARITVTDNVAEAAY